jgi:uncharacterized RDD family membrane protein YckC
MEPLHIAEAPLEGQSVYAGLWQRVVAKCIDFILLGICLLPVDIAFGTSFVRGGLGHETHGRQQLVVFVLFCLYSAILESSKLQATFGKRMVGIIVTDSTNARIWFRSALLRSLVQFLVPVDYVFALFSKSRETLHDLMANTQVLPGSL